jgi:hypothetical protein
MTLEKPELKWTKTTIKFENVHCAVFEDSVFMIFEGLKLTTVRLWENRELTDSWSYESGKFSIEQIKKKIERSPVFIASQSRLQSDAICDAAPIKRPNGFFFSALSRTIRTRFERRNETISGFSSNPPVSTGISGFSGLSGFSWREWNPESGN